MTTTIRREYLDCVAIAKRLRADLRAAFPGTKFSIRSDRFSGGSSVDVRWTDGPRTVTVQPFLDRYSFRHFDGMDDSMHYSSEAVVRSGELVEQSGNAFVHGARRWSPETRDRICVPLWARYGFEFHPGERAEWVSENPDHLVTLDGSSSVEAIGAGPWGGREHLWTLAHRYFVLWDGVTGQFACWQCDKMHAPSADCYGAA